MSDKTKTKTKSKKDTCIVCYRDVLYYSVGLCEHSVCFECSGRMRVLLEQNECPICRQSLEHVIFTKALKPYKDLKEKLRMFIMIPQFGIYIEDEDIKFDFDNLLSHRCAMCVERPSFRDFPALRAHMQRTHDLFACDLCVENIKLFSRERKYYTRADLAYHKRKGDRNDTSHRGHPLCQFCEKRYFDGDELFKHLRKDHFFCHFCDADGKNHFYDTYNELRVHFRCEHFLCEEEHCKDEQFTSVFRTEIDLKAHLASVHSRLLGRHAMKQARTLDVEFTLAPRPEDERRKQRFQHGQRNRTDDRDHRDRDRGDRDPLPLPIQEPEPPPPPPEIDTDSAKEFPSLGGAQAPIAINGPSIAQKVGLSSGRNTRHVPQWNAKVTGSSKMEEEFPALVEFSPTPAAKFGPPKKPIPKTQVPSTPVEDFPSLPTKQKPSWAKSGGKKPPAPKPPPDFNFIALPTGRKKEKNNNIPIVEPKPTTSKKGKKQSVETAKSAEMSMAATALFNGTGGSTVAQVREKKRAELRQDDFPSLSKPPPGFEPKVQLNQNGTFMYIQPPNFSQRNQTLKEAIRTSLNSDDSSCEVFRAVSNQYRKGDIAAKEYYELCRDMFGVSDFRVLFVELLALLPDIKRQQDLLMAHRIPGGSMDGLSSCHVCGQVLKSSDVTLHVQSHASDSFPSLA